MKRGRESKDEELAEDRCFTCGRGGNLRVCDFRNCLKAYHPHCVGKDAAFLESDEHWTCGWHSCFICQEDYDFQCNCCPNSICLDCIEPAEFIPVGKKSKGFCCLCLELGLYAECSPEKGTDREEGTSFKDHWMKVREAEGLTTEDPRDAHSRHTYTYTSDNTGGSDSDANDMEDCQAEVTEAAKSEYEDCKMKVLEPSKSEYAALTEANIKSVYLRRSLILELLNDPETFENKVVGCFVRVKNNPKDLYYSPRKPYELGQVKSIKKIAEAYKVGQRITDTVLYISNMRKDVPISVLSDEDIEEGECEDLRQMAKKGLLKRLNFREIEEKIKVVHADITNYMIDREIRRLHKLIEKANEKGWREDLEYYIDGRELLRKPDERARLLKELPSIIPDIEEDFGGANTMPSEQGKGSPKKPGSEAVASDKIIPGESVPVVNN